MKKKLKQNFGIFGPVVKNLLATIIKYQQGEGALPRCRLR